MFDKKVRKSTTIVEKENRNNEYLGHVLFYEDMTREITGVSNFDWNLIFPILKAYLESEGFSVISNMMLYDELLKKDSDHLAIFEKKIDDGKIRGIVTDKAFDDCEFFFMKEIPKLKK